MTIQLTESDKRELLVFIDAVSRGDIFKATEASDKLSDRALLWLQQKIKEKKSLDYKKRNELQS